MKLQILVLGFLAYAWNSVAQSQPVHVPPGAKIEYRKATIVRNDYRKATGRLAWNLPTVSFGLERCPWRLHPRTHLVPSLARAG